MNKFVMFFGMLLIAVVVMAAATKIPGVIRLKYNDDVTSGVQTFSDLKLLNGDRGLVALLADVSIDPAPISVYLDDFIEGPLQSIQDVFVDENGVWHGVVVILDGTHVWEPEEGSQPWVMKMVFVPAVNEESYTMIYTIDFIVLEDDDHNTIGELPMVLSYEVVVAPTCPPTQSCPPPCPPTQSCPG